MLGVRNVSKEERYANYAMRLQSLLERTRGMSSSEAAPNRCINFNLDGYESKIGERLSSLKKSIAELKQRMESGEENSHDDQLAKTPTPTGEAMLEVEEEIDERVPALPFGKESILLILPLVTASLRSVNYAVSKIYAMRFLTDISRYLDDEVVLQRILPHLVNVLTEACRPTSPTPEYASVMSNVGMSERIEPRRFDALRAC